MKLWEAIILGLVQGISEFLPISSSGHLGIMQNLFQMQSVEENHMLFSILLHLATLVSVSIFYWKDIVEMVQAVIGIFRPSKLESGKKATPAGRLVVMIIITVLPLILVLPVKDYVERLTMSTTFIALALILTGFMLFVSDKMKVGKKTERNMTILDALIVGVCQAIAVIPGLSRSGTTITAGVATGLTREFAVKFSFLISLPAVLGANILEIASAISSGGIQAGLIPIYLAGMLVAGVVGYFAIGLVKMLSKSGKFGYFAYYCWAAGTITLILSMII